MAVNNTSDPEHLYGLVDMGSNGIRFSISDLSAPTTRILPTLYTSRAGISLYDAQYDPETNTRIPIPDHTIAKVLNKLHRFKRTCSDFGVPCANITILATEATRTALNSLDFRQSITHETGWEVTMLAKEDEGRVGALGVATSLGQVKGLVMDLGGGSTQLTWLLSDSKGIKMPDQGAVSMPFGAAALSRRLSEAEAKGSAARRELADDIQQRITEAFESLHVPAELSELANNEGGYALYLSGGGFRGWGAILMSQHRVCPYPIPVINGFSAPRADFLDTDAISAAVSELDSDQDEEAIFRVSQRRANQVPAVAFLVTALSRALPQIKEVRFCQGGVREGFLFSKLDGQIRKQSPVVVATAPLSSPCSAHYATLLFSSIPHETRSEMLPTPDIMTAFSNLSAHFSTHPKDVRAAAALRSTTTGILASAHGLSHHERALLALLLCERWGGKKHLPPTDLAFFQAMQALVGREHTWWTGYLGRVAALIGAFYPSGKGSHDLVLQSRWQITKKGEEMLVLCVADCKGESVNGLVGEEMERIEKVGKKKNWCGGREGYGFKVLVQ